MDIRFIFIFSLLVGGIILIILGSLVLFSKRFLEMLHKTIWKPGKISFFSERDGYIYDRYVTGIGGIILGLMFLAFALWTFLD